jgi:hypothetical protein
LFLFLRLPISRIAMTSPEYYRSKALELRAKARAESDPILRADHERLADSYLALADHLNSAGDDARTAE